MALRVGRASSCLARRDARIGCAFAHARRLLTHFCVCAIAFECVAGVSAPVQALNYELEFRRVCESDSLAIGQDIDLHTVYIMQGVRNVRLVQVLAWVVTRKRTSRVRGHVLLFFQPPHGARGVEDLQGRQDSEGSHRHTKAQDGQRQVRQTKDASAKGRRRRRSPGRLRRARRFRTADGQGVLRNGKQGVGHK
eukprot:4285699-Pleurochrysis_carterae.AAC.4